MRSAFLPRPSRRPKGFHASDSLSIADWFRKTASKLFGKRYESSVYVEGQNIIIDYRFADGKSERLPGLVAELVALKVDVIVTAGDRTRQARGTTGSSAIVMMNNNNAVGGSFDSLARPGGNITGLRSTNFDLADKRLELLKEIVPKLSRVAVLRDLTNQAAELAGREIDPTARALKLQVQWFDLAKVKTRRSI